MASCVMRDGGEEIIKQENNREAEHNDRNDPLACVEFEASRGLVRNHCCDTYDEEPEADNDTVDHLAELDLALVTLVEPVHDSQDEENCTGSGEELNDSGVEDGEDAIEALAGTDGCCRHGVELCKRLSMRYEDKSLRVLKHVFNEIAGAVVPFVGAEAVL